MILTNQVSTSTGAQFSNLYGDVLFHTDNLLVDGTVQCELSFYKSEIDKNAKADKIYPVVNGSKVVNCKISCALTDVVKVDAGATLNDVVTYFFTKVITQLTTTYGWTITA